MTESVVVEIAVRISASMLIGALLLSFGRMAKGPDLPHRMLALDLIAVITIGLIIVTILEVGRTAFLIVAMIQSLVAFSGTVAVAKYLEKRR